MNGPLSIGRVHQPKPAGEASQVAAIGWSRPDADPVGRPVMFEAGFHADEAASGPPDDRAAHDDNSGIPERQTASLDQIVPKRRGTQTVAEPSERVWTSYEFWMGIVAGAAAVLVVKTILAVRAPFGVDWYSF
ncbi:MAG: hypothetical protein R3F54_13745 [Alphaproteobacteria bacterium]